MLKIFLHACIISDSRIKHNYIIAHWCNMSKSISCLYVSTLLLLLLLPLQIETHACLEMPPGMPDRIPSARKSCERTRFR